MSLEPFSLYVHIPFCDRKCPYCDFNTYAVTRPPERQYVAALKGEIESFRDNRAFVGRALRSVFFGGGTPSVLSAEGVGSILELARACFPFASGAEITLEANPNHARPELFKGYRAVGVNRISFGVQSFDDKLLSYLGREHSASQARKAVLVARDAGIENVSVDIIFGAPEQTIAGLERDLEQAIALPIRHISTYSLTIEPGTPFFQRQERGLLKLPPDTRVAEMLERVPVVLEAANFKRYEISNYAQSGSESVHNLAYWRGGDYLGVGAGAHSYFASYEAPNGAILSAERWSNLAIPSEYGAAIEAGRSGVSWRERLGLDDLKFEFLYLGLRCTAGVSEAEYKVRFGESVWHRFGDGLGQLEQEGFIRKASNGGDIALTPAGIALADSVFERLLDYRE